jgi:hypothetical protein
MRESMDSWMLPTILICGSPDIYVLIDEHENVDAVRMAGTAFAHHITMLTLTQHNV